MSTFTFLFEVYFADNASMPWIFSKQGGDYTYFQCARRREEGLKT